MANTPEGKVKDAVKAACKKLGIYYHMPVQNGMGKPTLDFILCADGMFIGIETKAPGKQPTPRQELTMSEMRKSGGCTMVIDTTDVLKIEANILILKEVTRATNEGGTHVVVKAPVDMNAIFERDFYAT